MSGYLKEGEMRKILNITMLLMLFVDVCFFILLPVVLVNFKIL